MKVKTADEVKAQLSRRGISVRQWAKANDLKPTTVYEVLEGKQKGIRGEAHRAAVLLGMKEGELVSAHEVKNALRTRP